MKPIVLAFMLMLIECSLSLAATDCRVVEYPDRSEVICIGDEKAKPDTVAPATPSRATIADYIEQNQAPDGSQSPAPAPSRVTPDQAAVPSGVTSHQTAAPAVKAETAADHLAKRRELATRNTRALKNHSSVTTPPVQ